MNAQRSLHFGPEIVSRADLLAAHSDQREALTVTYLTPAHRAVAEQIGAWMVEAGMQVHSDALGNVVGRYAGLDANAKTLVAGSHFDTVRNGGRFDGRLGILLPISVVRHLHEHDERLPFHLEIVAFAEEEGVRFRTGFLASSALIGEFDMALLDRTDADGVTMRDAMRAAGLPGDEEAIAALARDPRRLAGYIEVHIEQGPVLLDRALPLGVVTSIAGGVRMTALVRGMAGHAGTTPMPMRRDAATAAAEMILAIERRCSRAPTLVGTTGMLNVPNGATNVIPGRCEFSIDIRAGDDATRDAAVDDVVSELKTIARRREVELELAQTMRVPCAPCSPRLMDLLAQCIEKAGVSPLRLASGAGHDAMILQRVTEVCMLFVRCGNAGISHNPLESLTADDADIAARVFLDFLRSLRP
jgi:N-carbamoyl-L-amino-acid hydrolase